MLEARQGLKLGVNRVVEVGHVDAVNHVGEAGRVGVVLHVAGVSQGVEVGPVVAVDLVGEVLRVEEANHAVDHVVGRILEIEAILEIEEEASLEREVTRGAEVTQGIEVHPATGDLVAGQVQMIEKDEASNGDRHQLATEGITGGSEHVVHIVKNEGKNSIVLKKLALKSPSNKILQPSTIRPTWCPSVHSRRFNSLRLPAVGDER